MPTLLTAYPLQGQNDIGLVTWAYETSAYLANGKSVVPRAQVALEHRVRNELGFIVELGVRVGAGFEEAEKAHL